jgi:mono/diheme cytochrome c family protein/sugar lactone lactonase YvrE
LSPTLRAAEQQSIDYSALDAIFSQHCLDCHAAQDPEGDFVLESFETLMKGGDIGPAILPGKSGDSLIVKMIEGRFEKEGKKKIMPPGKRAKLTAEEIATVKNWIDAGAPAPAAAMAPREIVVPRVKPKVSPCQPVNALAYAPATQFIAVARYSDVEVHAARGFRLLRLLAGHTGNVNSLAFSGNGAQLFAVAGQPGLFGEIHQWSLPEGALVRSFKGHKDAIYSVALSPDGKILATGSYDQKIKLWNAESGEEIRTLSGHNGCVYDLAFRPDGKILASASADRAVKLWDVASGERRDTLSQPLKEVYCVAFSPDGKRLYAGGADNRIRVWEISESAAETTNPILESRFAHEGTVLNLILSADGKTLASAADDSTVKLRDALTMKERLSLEKQPDWPPALAFIEDDKIVAVGRVDGSVGFYNVTSGQTAASLPPEVNQSKVLAGASPVEASRRGLNKP